MKFRNNVDVSAPIDVVFAEASDFVSIEQLAITRGADVQRLDILSEPGVGMVWDVSFPYRGKIREVEVELVAFDSPNRMRFVSRSSSFSGNIILEFLALSRSQTRVSFEFDLKAQNLTARLVLQSIKLMRSNVVNKIQSRMKDWAQRVENLHQMSDVS